MKTSYATILKMMPFMVAALGVPAAHAEQTTAASSNLKWVKAPASLPTGAKVAMLQGDLAKSGALAFRLKLPAGSRVMPQSSPAIERIIVVSGALHLGTGQQFDSKRTIPLYQGYAHWPSNSPFFAFTKEETVLEIQGVGPWAVKYVNSADDPMAKKHLANSAVR